MSAQQPSAQHTFDLNTRMTKYRWSPRSTVLLRALWVAVFILQVALSAIALPPFFSAIQRASGTPIDTIFVVGVQLLMTLTFWTIGALIIVRSPTERIAYFVSLALLLVGTLSPPARATLLHSHHSIYLISEISATVGWASFFAIFFCLFPDGRFVPGWSWLLALGWYAINVPGIAQDFLPDARIDLEYWPVPVLAAVVGVLVSLSIYAQIYRYRHVSSPKARMQTK